MSEPINASGSEMTAAEKVAALLRESGAAYAEFDDSSTDGNCWIVETKDAWFQGLAEEIVELVTTTAAPYAEHGGQS